MKETKAPQGKKKTAEEWVTLAKVYGEDCVKVQRDTTLSPKQKLDKQDALSKEIIHVIQVDAFLTANEKKQMTESIQGYMDEWRRLSKMINEGVSPEALKSKLSS